jgi:hypothetical protein
MIPVHTQIISARKGRTLAIVSINWNINENQAYINISHNNLSIQVSVLLASCACKNISSEVTFHCSNSAIGVPFDAV